MIAKKEAINIACRYWKVKRSVESVGMRYWVRSVCKGNSDSAPNDDFEIPPRKKLFENCWIIEMFNTHVKDYSSAYIAWVDRKTGKVVRSGIYEVHCAYDFSRWFIETTGQREIKHKLKSDLGAHSPDKRPRLF